MSNRRPIELPDPAPRERSFRLRHLLFLAAMAGLASFLVPRARAAFALHTTATAAADYGACMVGPTGPSLVRDASSEFGVLVRRRLLSADAESFPFAECATLAETVSGSHEVARAHRARAQEFVEFGGPAGTATTSLVQLSFTLGHLKELATRAWPLERSGYAHLVRASSHAKEAPHPVAPVLAAKGSGLPGWRALYASAWFEGKQRYLAVGHASNLALYSSGDGGLRWQPASLGHTAFAKHAGRCVGAEGGPSFTVEFQESSLLVDSLLLDHVVSKTRIEGASDVLATSCDEQAMLMAVVRAGQRELFVCAHGGRCGRVPHRPDWVDGHFDIARVAGANVVATARAGIVRVRSTRDEGRTWTPDTVAFDWASHALGTDVKVPSRLLAQGAELFLYGAAERGQSYPVLRSLDMGASWHAPVAGAQPSAVAARR